MGYYLNSASAFSLYESEANSPYFVDKSLLLKELFPLVDAGNKHICITRPRRFGKSVMAAMVAAFFGKGIDSSSIFDTLKISEKDAKNYMNQYNVIYINFIKPSTLSRSYNGFIHRIEKGLTQDLRRAFPDVNFWEEASPLEDLSVIYEETGEKFILVFDEWDCIFHKDYITDEDRRSYINWLAALTKDTGYVRLSYMTGILPIAKYSSGSIINNFDEYTMATDDKFSSYFGFTESEVDELYSRYETRVRTGERNVLREDLKLWYDGYHTSTSERIYNPRSVVYALDRNRIRSYWSATGPYSEISNYIKKDRDDIKKDVALMVSGESIEANVEEFAATAMDLNTKDEIFSAMVVYGFLDYEDGKVRIPNRELMDEFAKTIREKNDLGYINRLATE